MSNLHSPHRSGSGNPYTEVLSEDFLINADGFEVKRTKVKRGRPAITRFLEKIIVSETRFFEGTPCWEWQGCKSNGYGQFKKDGRRGAKKSSPHQFSHEYFIGPIPDAFEVDHRCRNRGCGSPFHLEAITLQENRKRRGEAQTECKNGHEFTEENTHIGKQGERRCRECGRNRVAAFYAANPGYNAKLCQDYQRRRKGHNTE